MGEPRKRKRINVGVLLGITVGLIVVAGAVLRVAVYQLFKHGSGSMLPTIAPSEYVLVNKLATTAPRGSVIAFASPENREQRFVKRVIGRPGDRLEVIGGRPSINGRLVPRCEVGRLTLSHGAAGSVFVEFLEDSSYLVVHEISMGTLCQSDRDCRGGSVCSDGRCGERQGPWELADGELFVMGDNRDNSHDSRTFQGGRGAGVPLENVIGAVLGTSPPELPAQADPAHRAALKKCLADGPPEPGGP